MYRPMYAEPGVTILDWIGNTAGVTALKTAGLAGTDPLYDGSTYYDYEAKTSYVWFINDWEVM